MFHIWSYFNFDYVANLVIKRCLFGNNCYFAGLKKVKDWGDGL